MAASVVVAVAMVACGGGSDRRAPAAAPAPTTPAPAPTTTEPLTLRAWFAPGAQAAEDWRQAGYAWATAEASGRGSSSEALSMGSASNVLYRRLSSQPTPADYPTTATALLFAVQRLDRDSSTLVDCMNGGGGCQAAKTAAANDLGDVIAALNKLFETTTGTTLPATTTTTAPMSAAVWLSTNKAGIFRLSDIMGAAAIDTQTPSINESTCNLLLAEVDLERKIATPADQRTASEWAAILGSTDRTAAACRTRPRAFTSADFTAAMNDGLAMTNHLQELVAAATAQH